MVVSFHFPLCEFRPLKDDLGLKINRKGPGNQRDVDESGMLYGFFGAAETNCCGFLTKPRRVAFLAKDPHRNATLTARVVANPDDPNRLARSSAWSAQQCRELLEDTVADDSNTSNAHSTAVLRSYSISYLAE